jgi:hypothetical protein
MRRPPEGVVRLTPGYSRDHRLDLNQVMLELIMEHQAGIPLLMKPLSGNSSDSQEFGHIVRDHIGQLHNTYGTTYVVADSALYSEDNLTLLNDIPTKWITRVPGTLNEVKAALAQADPEQMTPLKAGYRGQTLTSTYGGVTQRWLLIESQPRRPQARRTINKRWLKHSEKEVQAWRKLGRREFACEADARQALETFEQRLTYTHVQTATIVATPHDDKPGARRAERRPARSATPSTGRWGRLWPNTSNRSDKRVVSCWPPMNSMPRACPPWTCSRPIRANSMPNAASAFSRAPSFSRRRSISKSPNASWRC